MQTQIYAKHQDKQLWSLCTCKVYVESSSLPQIAWLFLGDPLRLTQLYFPISGWVIGLLYIIKFFLYRHNYAKLGPNKGFL